VNHHLATRSPAQVADGLRARVLAAVEDQPALTRGERRAQAALLAAAAAVVSVTVFLVAGGVRTAPRPPLLVAATSIGTAGLAALALLLGAWSGRQMSRSRAALWAALAVLPAALLLWKTGLSALFDGMRVAWPERVGYRCLRLTLLMGAGPLAAALYALRESDPVHPFTRGAALGAGAGLAAAVLVDLWCPVAYLPHLFLGHLVPIAALAAVGAIGGLALRPRRR
jgi:hypothetical protein